MDSTEAVRQYIAWKGSYAPRAGVCYEPCLRDFFKHAQVPVEGIRLEHVVDFQNAINKKYGEAYVAMYVIAIRDFLRYWKQQGIAQVDTYFIRVPKVPYHIPSSVTPQEYAKLCAMNKDERMKLLVIKFLWQTGVRVSELCDIKLSDITLDLQCNIQTKKVKRPRWIFWESDTEEILREHINELLAAHPNATHVFVNHEGEKLNVRSIQRWVKEAFRTAGLAPKTPHAFRHGFAHDLLRNGANVKDVQEMLGHNRPESSFKYMVLNNSEIKLRARELSNARFSPVHK